MTYYYIEANSSTISPLAHPHADLSRTKPAPLGQLIESDALYTEKNSHECSLTTEINNDPDN